MHRLLIPEGHFVPRPVKVGFVMDEVAMGRFLFNYFDFPLLVSVYQCSSHS
jgi:hypothetical protein